MARAAQAPAIVDLEDTVESVNMILYGDPGVGKTVQAGKLPNNLIISTDVSGTVSAKRQGSKAKLIQAYSMDDFRKAYEYLKAGDHPFEWVTIDTGTRLQEMIIRDILELAVEENENRSLDIPAIQDHQAWQNRFKRFMDHFIALPVNVLFTFHVMTVEDEEGEEIRLPQLQGGKAWPVIARAMPAKVSVMGFMHTKWIDTTDEDGKKVKKEVRRTEWRNGASWMAKDRYDCLPRHTDDVPLDKIVERILSTGQQPKEAAPTAKKPAAKRTAAATKAAPRPRTTAKAKVTPEEEDDD